MPNSLGNYLTYNFFGITASKNFPEITPPIYLDNNILTKFQAIVVINPETDEIVHTEVKQQARPLTHGGGENYLYGYEPSISIDGRLLVYSGNPYHGARPGNGGMVTYSYTSNAFSDNGWSAPRNIADMYEVHGPDSANEVIINGQKFSDIFPLARHDVVDYNGTPVSEVFGAYPWLSFDASEAFFQTIPGWHGGRRHGTTMVGSRTMGKLMNVDGDFSLTRGNPTGETTIYRIARASEFEALTDAYSALKYPNHSTDLCTVNESGAQLNSAYNEVLMAPIALFGTSWDPFLEQNNPPLPLSQSDLTYGFLSGAGRKYVEVPIVDNMDSLILYYPMNEPIEYDNALITPFIDYLDRRLDDPDIPEEDHETKQFNRFVSHQVADYSPYHHTGDLHLASFPYEHCNVDTVWQDGAFTGQLFDLSNGAIGNSVVFEPGSNITTELTPTASERIIDSQEFTAAFWAKRGDIDPVTKRSEAQSVALSLADLFAVRLNKQNVVVVISTDTTENTFSESGDRLVIPTQITSDWNHYAIRVKAGSLTVFLNGEEIGSDRIIGDFILPGDSEFNVTIGPSQSLRAIDNMQMDEVYLYATGLSKSEISKLAWRKQQVNKDSSDNPISFFQVPEKFAGLPQKSIDLPNGPDGIDEDNLRILGKKLFETDLLSKDSSKSCSSCHNSELFADNIPFSEGVGENQTDRNTPVLINHLFSEDFFLGGKVSNLEEQVLHPLLSNSELGIFVDDAALFANLESQFGSDFDAAFGVYSDNSHVNYSNISISLSHYIRGLFFTPFERPLTRAEIKGKQIFEERGNCIACHSGPNFTDNEFHNIGLDQCENPETDIGRKAVTVRDGDCGKFKTPTLLGISDSGPYFHDGRAANLRDVLNHYNAGIRQDEFTSEIIRPLDLSETHLSELEAYLNLSLIHI